MMRNNKLEILQVEVGKVDYSDILKSIKKTYTEEKQIILTGANVNTINLALKNLKYGELLSNFDIIHPDGIGLFLASKFLYGKNGFKKRITGSDFYIELIKESLKNNWSFFIFGDKCETLNKISKVNPRLNIRGLCNGFNFNNDELIKNVNTSQPDILIVGIGSPQQEEWIIDNKNNIPTKIIIAVGDGIKVFAGNKKRGPKIFQKIGLEWFIRFLYEPKRLWKRYFIGIPLFIFRIIKFKFMNTKTG
jgi:N-acetylglucosaminyldiphosphoundecaprenol N-acetyl-beta-D-mannosaminyltransferase